MMRLLLPVLLFAFSLSATTFPVSTAPLADPPETRSVPQLVAGAHGYLAAWIDERSGGRMLLAARIDGGGTVLDPTGIAIAPVPGDVAAVWNGEQYLLFFARGADLVMRSVAEDGTLGAIRPVVPNALADPAEPLDAATNGQRIVIAYAGDWLNWQVKARMHAAVLAMDGTLVDDLLLDDTRTDQLRPSVALNDVAFAVGWNRMIFNADQALVAYGLRGVRLDARGVRLDAQPRDLGQGHRHAFLEPNGSSFLADRKYEATFVSGDLGTIGTAVERPPGNFFTLRGAAATIDEDHAPVSGAEIPRWVHVVPFDAAGRPGSGKRLLRATDDGYHAVAGAAAVQRGEHVLAAWVTYRGNGSGMRIFTTIASAFTLETMIPPQLLTRSAAAQRNPAIAAGHAEAVVAWTQPDGIYAGRVTADGRPLDGPGVRLTSVQTSHPPAVAYHDGRYAVAYGQFVSEQLSEVVVHFFSPSAGLLAETIRIPVTRWDGAVALGSGGGALVLLYTSDNDLLATRLHAAGTFDPPVPVIENALVEDPLIVWNGTQFLAAWTDVHLDWDIVYYRAVSGRRMSADLQFADAEPLTLASLGLTWQPHEPSLASNGSEWFLTWTGEVQQQPVVRIQRIAADGSVADVRGGALASGFGSEIVWNGRRLAVAWKDTAAGNPLLIAPLTPDALGIDRDGQRTLDPNTMIYDGSRQVSLTRWGSGWAAVYPSIAGAAEGHVPRVYATLEARVKGKVRAIR